MFGIPGFSLCDVIFGAMCATAARRFDEIRERDNARAFEAQLRSVYFLDTLLRQELGLPSIPEDTQ